MTKKNNKKRRRNNNDEVSSSRDHLRSRIENEEQSSTANQLDLNYNVLRLVVDSEHLTLPELKNIRLLNNDMRGIIDNIDERKRQSLIRNYSNQLRDQNYNVFRLVVNSDHLTLPELKNIRLLSNDMKGIIENIDDRKRLLAIRNHLAWFRRTCPRNIIDNRCSSGLRSAGMISSISENEECLRLPFYKKDSIRSYCWNLQSPVPNNWRNNMEAIGYSVFT